MRKNIIPAGAILLAGLAYGQVTNTENYIQTKTYLDYPAGQSPKIQETVEYIDGLGRSKQIVNVKASPSGKDMVTPVVYDALGRQTREYLAVPQASTTNGAIYQQAQGLTDFPVGDPTNIYTGEKAFTEKLLESSPLDRILEKKQIGTAWQGKPVKFEYQTNSVNDKVRKFTATTTWSGNTAVSSVIWSLNDFGTHQLYKNMTIDEDGNKTIEFKNGQEQLILTRKVISDTENADTYYVYNEYNQLVLIIPPKAVYEFFNTYEANPGDSLTDDLLSELCYQYNYDGRNRLVEKKLPGKGWEYQIYDMQDRLVMTQDANLGALKQWMFTKYDQLGRVAYTGIYTSPQSYGRTGRVAEQTNVNAKGSNNTLRTASVSFTNSGMGVYYDNSSSTYPSSITKLLSVRYYDTYPQYSFNPSFLPNIQEQPVLTDNISTDGKSTKGLAVMNLIKNIEDDNWTKNYSYFDFRGRLIAVHSINHLLGYTRTESKLDFAGALQKTVIKHKRLAADTEKVIAETFEYDSQNRLKKHYHQVDGNAPELLADNTYNELSQLTSKKVGNNLQNINYTYNIRGWLTKINDPGNLSGKLFGYEIKYHDPHTSSYSKAKYNGDITDISWKTANDGILKRYYYRYDNLNRLVSGLYLEPDTTIPMKYTFAEEAAYDLNGNITSLMRTGNESDQATSEYIDDLNLNYYGNKLISVNDASQNFSGYPGGGNIISYDGNANMTSQLDKEIKKINYNHLNLPSSLVFTRQLSTPTGLIPENSAYLYRADGVKVKKIYNQAISDPFGGANELTPKTTDYLDGFQYQTFKNKTGNFITALQFFPTSEGYYDFVRNKYIYNYTDHLGNVRLSYFHNGSNIEVLEENNYYPFGLKYNENSSGLSATASYQYKYNGKEFQTDTKMYDYGARMYMPELGRWGSADGKGELYLSKSPYSYANNTPVNAVDPDGNLVIFINGQHSGNGGTPDYWTSGTLIGHLSIGEGGAPLPLYKRFDMATMRHLNDYNAIYRDGGLGGWSNTFFAAKNVNISVENRINTGFDQGKKDAAEIIKNLERDSSTGEIIETIKVVTHSMGGAYGKGYVKALKEYVSTLPAEMQKQIKITLVADFDPFQAGSLEVDPNIKTQQFIHEDTWNITGFGFLANEKEKGISDKDTYINTGSSTDHFIDTFFKDISKLQEGTYEWNGSSWECTDCNH